jgi:hypothetical protein
MDRQATMWDQVWDSMTDEQRRTRVRELAPRFVRDQPSGSVDEWAHWEKAKTWPGAQDIIRECQRQEQRKQRQGIAVASGCTILFGLATLGASVYFLQRVGLTWETLRSPPLWVKWLVGLAVWNIVCQIAFPAIRRDQPGESANPAVMVGIFLAGVIVVFGLTRVW